MLIINYCKEVFLVKSTLNLEQNMSTLAYTKKAFQTFSGIGREIAEKIVNTDLGSALKNEELLRRILISSRLEVDLADRACTPV